MNKMMKMCSVLVSVMMAGSVGMAQYHGRGDHRGDHRGGYRGGYHGYSDEGRRYGYYHNARGEVVFGLVGLLAGAAIASSITRSETVYVQQPVYVQPEPRVVYVQQPAVVQPPQIVYVQQPQVVKEPEPKIVYVPQPVQIEPPQSPSQPEAQSQPVTVTISVQNSNGSFTPVLLRQEGARWIGPNGESYREVPSVGQLRPLYGR